MNQKGFAASGVLYTILIIGLVSIVSLLYDLQNKKSVLDKLKLDVVEATNEACADPGFDLYATAYATSSAKPSSSMENAIAVITTTSIGKTSLSKVSPTNPASGDIWVSLSYFDNNYIVYNNITIPIAYVQQYISGSWVYKEAYIYHGSTWSALNDLTGSYTVKNYGYTGSTQTFVAPATGYYKLETWGASGGLAGSYAGGKGGYSTGVYHMNSGETAYVYVGGTGISTCTTYSCLGGYNGGGIAGVENAGSIFGSGGGATDIRLKAERKKYRYVKDYSTNNSVNAGNHWVEIQVYDITNSLISSGATSTGNCGTVASILTDGVTTSANYTGTCAGEGYVEIDLGKEYEIGKVVVWHYYTDGRSYYNTKTYLISADRTVTTSVHDYAVTGNYVETASGKTMVVDGTTDVSSLQSRIIVAAGGGGATQSGTAWYGVGGIAGGTSGISGGYALTYTTHPGGGGTQTAGGTSPNCGYPGLLGVGGGRYGSAAGGGGGYYGGGCGYGGGGGGGSGYIGGVTSYGSVTAATTAGNVSFPSTGGTTETGHSGDGYAKITLLSLG